MPAKVISSLNALARRYRLIQALAIPNFPGLAPWGPLNAATADRGLKTEARNPKPETNPNHEGHNRRNQSQPAPSSYSNIWNFTLFRSLFRISDFGFRISASLALVVLTCAVASSAPAAISDAEAAARQTYQSAQQQFRDSPSALDPAWQFARACFDLAEFATKSADRAKLAQQGIDASRQALARNSNSAPAHYYLGMNFGQLARTKGLGALKLVNQMEREFSVARALDEHFDHAGPDRNLGLLYRDAPAIGSIGSRSKARQHLTRAVELEPGFPENGLNLVESVWKWGDKDAARRELAALEKDLPASRARLTGPAWAASWADWDARLADWQRKLDTPSKKLETPRH